jgi:hypothetical protein
MSATHLAGPAITFNTYRRQRCSWCGTCLIDEDLARIMVPEGQGQAGPGAWQFEALVRHDGPVWSVVTLAPDPCEDDTCGMPHPHYTAPEDACMRLPPEITK